MDNPEKRRASILKALQVNSSPITGTYLAKELNVSRQVIVQDIALLRAKGVAIIATPQGYILLHKGNNQKIRKTIPCKHNIEALETELACIIDAGGIVLDVIVEHPLYGELTGNLNLRSRYDLQEFMLKLNQENAMLLSKLTDGVHLHTIEVENEAIYERVKEELRDKQILLE